MKRSFVSCAVLVLLAAGATALGSDWNGAADNSWNTAANWDTPPSVTSGSPLDVRFLAGVDINGDPLTLDNTFYVRALRLGADGTASIANLNFGGVKDFANTPGTLVFQAAGGTNPSIVARMFNNNDGGGTLLSGDRSYRLNANVQIDAPAMTIQRTQYNPGGSGIDGSPDRRLIFAGELSGGSASSKIALTLTNGEDVEGARAIQFARDNPNLFADITLTGAVYLGSGSGALSGGNGLGDWGNLVTVSHTRNSRIRWHMAASTESNYSFVLDTVNDANTRQLQLYAGSGNQNRSLTLGGAITGGVAGKDVLRFQAQGQRMVVLTNPTQTFAGNVRVESGSEVVLAGANGTSVWENVTGVNLNEGAGVNANANNTTALLLRGDSYTLAAPLRIADAEANAANDNLPVAWLGEINSGATPYSVAFSGATTIEEDDYDQPVVLYAETGGRATFRGDIFYGPAATAARGLGVNTVLRAGGFYGTPDGEVVVNGRVSRTQGGTDSIGAVPVAGGTLRVESANFYGDITVASGAKLAGSGTITGTTLVDGTLTPGSSIGRLNLVGDLTLNGTLSVEVSGASADRVDLTGALTLGANSVLDVVGTLSDPSYTIFTFGSLSGSFQDFSDVTNQGYQVNYNPASITLTPVPEPSTLVLLATAALLGLVRRLRRRS